MANGVASVLPPPRPTGNAEADSSAQLNWLNDVAKILAGQQSTIGSLSGTAGDVDPNDLPDPASTNLATAQQTANDAYILASSAHGLAEKLRSVGIITISDVATTGDFTFPTAEADTAYFVLANPSDFTATPDAGSNIITKITKATNKVTLTIGAAPNTGNSVTFTVAIFRSPT
jgi:hypothetical protein